MAVERSEGRVKQWSHVPRLTRAPTHGHVTVITLASQHVPQPLTCHVPGRSKKFSRQAVLQTDSPISCHVVANAQL